MNTKIVSAALALSFGLAVASYAADAPQQNNQGELQFNGADREPRTTTVAKPGEVPPETCWASMLAALPRSPAMVMTMSTRSAMAITTRRPLAATSSAVVLR